MAPEIAMLVGVVIGALASAVTAYFVNQAAQRAEDRRLAVSLDAQAHQQEAEFTHRQREEERQAARRVREACLRPGLDFLEELQSLLTAATEQDVLEMLRESTEATRAMSEDEWDQLKRKLAKYEPPPFIDLVARYWRLAAAYPMEGLRKDFSHFILESIKVRSMSAQDRDDFARRVEGTRRSIEGEIIRADWP